MPRVRAVQAAQSGSWTPLNSVYLDWANGQRVAISGINAQSTVTTADTLYLVKATVDCFITVGTSPTATTGSAGSWPLSAGETLGVPVPNGQRVGAITTGTSGALYLLPATV